MPDGIPNKHFTIERVLGDFGHSDLSLVSYNLFPAPYTYPKEANINIKSMNTV